MALTVIILLDNTSIWNVLVTVYLIALFYLSIIHNSFVLAFTNHVIPPKLFARVKTNYLGIVIAMPYFQHPP